jgi:hypothetical protein
MTMESLDESPLRIARRHVNAELQGKQTPAELRWLFEHPVLWLRALQQTRYEVYSHIGKDRTNIAHLKPGPGTHPSDEYLQAKRELDGRSAGRIHFMQVVDNRIQEVISIIGDNRPVTTGELVSIFLELAQLIKEDDVQTAHDIALRYADQFAKKANP